MRPRQTKRSKRRIMLQNFAPLPLPYPPCCRSESEASLEQRSSFSIHGKQLGVEFSAELAFAVFYFRLSAASDELVVRQELRDIFGVARKPSASQKHATRLSDRQTLAINTIAHPIRPEADASSRCRSWKIFYSVRQTRSLAGARERAKPRTQVRTQETPPRSGKQPKPFAP